MVKELEFIYLLNEEGKEEKTKKAWQPFTLRYVGTENARIMHDQDLCMEEMTFNTK